PLSSAKPLSCAALPSVEASLSFPPLLSGFHAAGKKSYPGGELTWKKALAPRPLSSALSPRTKQELASAVGAHWNLLNRTLHPSLPEGEPSHASSPPPPFLPPSLPPSSGESENGAARRSMPLFRSVFARGSFPAHSQWDYCKKYGRPPKQVAAPRIEDLSSWFAEYGRPTELCGSGFRSEFAPTLKSVPRGQGETSASVRMIRGRVLR
ncbi:MAG: hypothetical protein SGPRY_006390, partial [Prymnesium sp.]